MRAVGGSALWGLASGAAAPASATVQPDATAQPAQAHPDIWPRYRYPATLTDAQEARLAELLARMTVAEKIGQLFQGDLCCVTQAAVRRYPLGSIHIRAPLGTHGSHPTTPDPLLHTPASI